MAIKLIENRFRLVEKKLNDVLTQYKNPAYDSTTIAQSLAQPPYNIDVENSNLIELHPDSISNKEDCLFIFKRVEADKGLEYYQMQLFINGHRKLTWGTLSGGQYEMADGTMATINKKDLGNTSFSWCKKYAYAAFIFDPLVLNTDIQAQRKRDKEGMVKRYKQSTYVDRMTGRVDPNNYVNTDDYRDEITQWSRTSLDKSGYILNPDKYKKMLAAVNKEAYTKYFDKATELFNRIDDIKKNIIKLTNNDVTNRYSTAIDGMGGVMSIERTIFDSLRNFAYAFKTNNVNDMVAICERLKKNLPEWEAIINKAEQGNS